MRGDGSIIRRKDSPNVWIQFCVRGKVYREKGGRTEAEARRRLKARRREIHGGRFVGPEEERLTVAEILDGYAGHLRSRQAKALGSVTSHLKPVRAALGALRAVDLQTVHLERYQQERLAAGKAPQTVDHELGSLRAALRLAKQQERLSRVPFVPMLRPDNRRRGFFEKPEFDAVAANLPEPIAEIAGFAYASGWRKGEIVSLRWEQIDRAAREVRLYTSKNGRGRVLPLEGELWEIVERRWAARQYELAGSGTALSAYVFHRRGQPVGDFRKAWAAACAKAAVPGRLFHDLRRTAVRDMIRAAVPQSVAMAVSGHRTLSVFLRYDIASEDDKRQALRATQARREALPGRQNVASFPKN